MSDIGLELKIARVMSGKSQDDLAAELGVSQASISRFEAGTQAIPDELRQRLLDAAGWNQNISLIIDGSPIQSIREGDVR